MKFVPKKRTQKQKCSALSLQLNKIEKVSSKYRFLSKMNSNCINTAHLSFVTERKQLPQDVFIGMREGGRVKPTLFFRDVGSHDTAPHYLAIDSQGRVHLTIADVNIFQDNRLDLYWMIGNPVSGKWTAAWLIDRRGFTSWSHPWSAAWGDKVHLLWTWCDVSINKRAPGMGAFHVEWSPAGFGRKMRVIPGVVTEWDAAIDPQTGRILIAFSKDDRVYVLSRSEQGGWTRAARLHPRLRKELDVSVEAAEGGAFIIRTGTANTREWVLRPQ